MFSNSNAPIVKVMYENFNIQPVQARRNINSKGSERGRIREKSSLRDSETIFSYEVSLAVIVNCPLPNAIASVFRFLN